MLIKSLVSYQKLGGLEERIADSHPFDPGSNPRRSKNFFLFFYKINQKIFDASASPEEDGWAENPALS